MKLYIHSNGYKKVVHFLAFYFSCLPSDLEGAVRQSSEAAGLFVSSGGMRATVCSRNVFSSFLYFTQNCHLFEVLHCWFRSNSTKL